MSCWELEYRTQVEQVPNSKQFQSNKIGQSLNKAIILNNKFSRLLEDKSKGLLQQGYRSHKSRFTNNRLRFTEIPFFVIQVLSLQLTNNSLNW